MCGWLGGFTNFHNVIFDSVFSIFPQSCNLFYIFFFLLDSICPAHCIFACFSDGKQLRPKARQTCLLFLILMHLCVLCVFMHCNFFGIFLFPTYFQTSPPQFIFVFFPLRSFYAPTKKSYKFTDSKHQASRKIEKMHSYFIPYNRPPNRLWGSWG